MKRWPTKPLGELLTTLENGSRPKGGVGELSDGIPSFGGEHINREGGFAWETPKHVTREFYAGMKRGRIQRGDILVVKDGATTGKTATVRGNFPFCEAAINEHVFLLRTDKDKALPEFVGYFLFGPVGQQQILSNFRGAAIGGIAQDFVRNVHVPLPPLAEQERIVKLLDEADALRKLRAQSDRRAAALIPALFHEMFGDIQTNRCRFPVLELGSLCKVLGGGTPSKQKPDYWIGKIPWVSPKDMSGDEVHDSEDHISEQAVKESATNLIPRGSVLVVTRSGILKHTFPVAINSIPVAINQDIKAFVPTPIYDTTFLAVQLRVLAPTILNLVRVGATVQNIETEALRRLSVLNPPLALQKEFAARVAEIRGMESVQSASRKRLDDLFQSMLHRAFEGEL